MYITEFLRKNGFGHFEGYCQEVPQQVHDMIELTSEPNINVMEIGFNAGHSAEVFLKSNPTLNLVSFDLGCHPYVNIAKKYIDETFPDRHTLLLGDSQITIPSFISNNKNTTFDVIFIDGGHTYDVAKSDIENCEHLAHKDTIVIMDDTIFAHGWSSMHTDGPTRVWNEKLELKQILEIDRKHYCFGRGMAWGKYNY